MTEPITPTGKRLCRFYDPGEVENVGPHTVAAIEREVAEQERARLWEAVEAIPEGCHSHSGLMCTQDGDRSCYLIDRHDVLDLLDPEPSDDV